MKTVKFMYGVIGAANGLSIAQLINYKSGIQIINAYGIKLTEQMYILTYGMSAMLCIAAAIVALKYHKQLENEFTN